MFTLVAATLFTASFLLAAGTIGWMFLTYHDKMVAALLFKPIPQEPPVYHIRINRPRVRLTQVRHAPARTGAYAA